MMFSQTFYLIIFVSLCSLSIPLLTLSRVQDSTNIISLFINLRYEKLKSALTVTQLTITPTPHIISLKSNKDSSVFTSRCNIQANRAWFGFKENFTSQMAGSLYFYCKKNIYKISFPVGKSLLRFYTLK